MAIKFKAFKLKLNPATIQRQAADVADGVQETIALAIVGDIKKELYQSKHSGRWYFKTKAARKRGQPDHHASAEGEPPAVDTGRMAISIMHQAFGAGKARTVYVGSNREALATPSIGEAYATRHKFGKGKFKAGAVTGSDLDYPYRLEAFMDRFWLRPIWDKYRHNLQSHIDRAVRHLRKIGWNREAA